jgi:ATP-dependent 26S proteasome regulatory subunit
MLCSYESTSGGEREIQRTMLELLNQLDGFDSRGDVKVPRIFLSIVVSVS